MEEEDGFHTELIDQDIQNIGVLHIQHVQDSGMVTVRALGRRDPTEDKNMGGRGRRKVVKGSDPHLDLWKARKHLLS